jgi:guanine deaminase
MNNSDTFFMQQAIDKAFEGIITGQTPFGACIVKDNKIISCEHNRVWETCDITAHAEVTAIRVTCKKLGTIDLSGCTIYSTCEPCPMCFSACHWAKISKIVYGTAIADAAHVGFDELKVSNEQLKQLSHSPVEICKNFMYQENLELFKQFQALDLQKKKLY